MSFTGCVPVILNRVRRSQASLRGASFRGGARPGAQCARFRACLRTEQAKLELLDLLATHSTTRRSVAKVKTNHEEILLLSYDGGCRMSIQSEPGLAIDVLAP